MRLVLSFAVPLAAIALASCGPDCQSTCNRLYQPKPNCDITSPGFSRDELLDTCMNACTKALETAGDVPPNYHPEQYTPADQSVTLQNDKQAAVWMDCIATTSCELLKDGYCAPVW